jgi:preprotein translocase subunit YajC
VGTVTFATPTSLTVTFSTRPQTAGTLTAVVTVNSVSSGAPVQVATVVPVVASNSANLANGATTMTINGFGFDPIAANNTVVFNNGAVGTVTSATATSLSISFSTPPAISGALTAVVTTNGENSGSPVQVATVAAAPVTPVVTMSTATLNANAGTMTINGANFSQIIANDTVVFNDGAVGTVTFAGTNFLTVTFSTRPQTAGPLTAVVTVNGISSGAPVQVATVAPVLAPPVPAPTISHTATTITIDGFGFDPIAANNTIVLSSGAVGHVISATTTSLIVMFDTPPAVGSLTAIVVTNGVSSGAAVKVANAN